MQNKHFNLIFKKLFILGFTFSFLGSSSSFAQNLKINNQANFCPYTFTQNLYLGNTSNDVLILQKILNSDSRTLIATTGVAAPGNETNYLGSSTKEAVKKFQALFIEYIGVANGVFGPKTRTVMNAVCNSEKFTNPNNTNTGNIYSPVSTPNTPNVIVSSSTDKLAPSIFIRSNNTSVNIGNSIRFIVTASEPIQKFDAASVIIEGGEIGEIRKLGPSEYNVLVSPKENAKIIVLQIEADRVSDLAGNLNESASNEIRISVIKPIAVVATSTTVAVATSSIPFDFQSIIDRIISGVATSTTKPVTKCRNDATNPPDCDSFRDNYNDYNNNGGQNSGGGLSGILSSLFGKNNNQSKNPYLGGGQFPNQNNNNQFPTGNNGGSYTNPPSPSPSNPSPIPNECISNPSLPQCGVVSPSNPSSTGETKDTMPKSGVVINKIACVKIETNNNSFINCDSKTTVYKLKEQDTGKEYVFIYRGTSKTIDEKNTSQLKTITELKAGYRFLVGRESGINLFKKLDGHKICASYTDSSFSAPKCVEANEAKGKSIYQFASESTASIQTTETAAARDAAGTYFPPNSASPALRDAAGSYFPTETNGPTLNAATNNTTGEYCLGLTRDSSLKSASIRAGNSFQSIGDITFRLQAVYAKDYNCVSKLRIYTSDPRQFEYLDSSRGWLSART